MEGHDEHQIIYQEAIAGNALLAQPRTSDQAAHQEAINRQQGFLEEFP